jgi:hypothetical protein
MGRIFGSIRIEVTRGWKSCVMRRFIILTAANYNYNHQVKDEETGGVGYTNGEEECM